MIINFLFPLQTRTACGKAVHATSWPRRIGWLLSKIEMMKEEHGLMQLFKRIGYFVLVFVGQFLLFWGTNWLFRKLKLRIMRLEKTRLKPFSIQGYELLDTRKRVRQLIFLANLVRYAFMFLQLLLTVPLLFSISRRLRTWPTGCFPTSGIR